MMMFPKKTSEKLLQTREEDKRVVKNLMIHR